MGRAAVRPTPRGIRLEPGAGLLAAALAVRHFTARGGGDEGAVRAATFATLVLGNLALIWTNRSRSRSLLALAGIPNAALAWVTALAVAALGLTLVLPAGRRLFHFAPIAPGDLLVAAIAAAACVAWFELLKRTPPGRT